MPSTSPFPRRPPALFAILATAALLAPPCSRADVPVREDIIVSPAPQKFTVCFNGTCKDLAFVSLSTAQWRRVTAIFTPPADSPAMERQRIAQAVALMEILVGETTRTHRDRPRNGSDPQGANQMDCIDESTNTTTYLKLLARDGLLHWYTVEDRATRGWFLFGWPHTTAVIRERPSGKDYVVDSWFLENGRPPFIVPLTRWRNGWQPPPDKP